MRGDGHRGPLLVTGSDRPVLLAYDGSPSSATAIAAAGRLLAGRRALVCHVHSGDASGEVVARGAELAREAGFAAEPLPEREHRKTWRVLLRAAHEADAEVVVAGSHGLSGMGRAVLGSVSTALVHHSPLPVLVVPGTVGEERTGGPLVLCYDGSEEAKRAISVAGELFTAREALVLHFWESWVAEAPALAGVTRSVRGMAGELDEIAKEQSTVLAAEGARLAQGAGLACQPLSERATGPGWQAVLEVAESRSCETIVVGSRGLGGISAALGSVSNGVVHHSRQPVLVVPPAGRAA